MGEPLAKFNPELDVPVNVTDILEQRHISHAVQIVSIALGDYLSGFSKYESLATTFHSGDYIWISIGDVPLSKRLKEAIRKKFKVDNGNLGFKNWEKMSSSYPDVCSFKHLHGKKPSFVGLPLPKEDDSEE